MAQTQGLVQRLKLTTGSVLAWAYIGPTATSTTLLLVTQESAAAADIAAFASMAEALSGALVSGKQVIATHDDGSSEITVLEVLAS